MQTDPVIIGYAVDLLKEVKNKLDAWAEYADKQAQNALPGTESKYVNTRDNYKVLTKSLEMAIDMISDENFCKDAAKNMF